MTEHPNVELTRRGYEAFAKGDLAALAGLLADDVTWHVTGAGPLSGTYHGQDEVFGFFGRLAEETDGTFRLDVRDVLANDEPSARKVAAGLADHQLLGKQGPMVYIPFVHLLTGCACAAHWLRPPLPA